jgi:hypothetical protein
MITSTIPELAAAIITIFAAGILCGILLGITNRK